jgi:hypothetical protein
MLYLYLECRSLLRNAADGLLEVELVTAQIRGRTWDYSGEKGKEISRLECETVECKKYFGWSSGWDTVALWTLRLLRVMYRGLGKGNVGFLRECLVKPGFSVVFRHMRMLSRDP